jgi:glyoxylase-like metal-dependent hydrolase (beta-lactamase superfamily II)
VDTELYRVYALRYARRKGVRGEHFFGFEPNWDAPHPTAYFVWLAVSEEHVVVVDAGMRAETAARIPGLDYLASPVTLLARLGFPPESVDQVVLTHLHYDHTGTARSFTDARFAVQKSEVDYWAGPWAKRITREHWLHDSSDLPDAGLDLVDGDLTVLPGLSVHHVGGHTAGMQIVRVNTARGHVVLASDACHFYENLETDRPFPILHSMPEMYGAFDRTVELADGPDLIVPGHDPEVLQRFPTDGDIARIA